MYIILLYINYIDSNFARMKNGNFGGIIWDGWGLKGYFSLDKVNEYL
jgi:hypothetical protein